MKGNEARSLVLQEDSEVLGRIIAEACGEAKGKELVWLDLREHTDMTDSFLIVSGRSDRQVQGIVNKILETTQQYGLSPYSIEGYEKGHWILLDYGEVVVHVFYEPIREYYDLEGLWGHVPRVPATDLHASQTAA